MYSRINPALSLLEQYDAYDKEWTKKPELLAAYVRREQPPVRRVEPTVTPVSPPVVPVARRVHVPAFGIGRHPEAQKCPFPMCFSPEAILLLLNTVGHKPPETGAKGFSPPQFIGFDLIEYDSIGSSGASGSVYTPTVAWGVQRRDYHQNAREMRLWTGDIHSHPGGISSPSSSYGPQRLGDLGYVEMVFEQNELMRYFLLPIITGSGTGNPTIHAWVCQRDVQRPMIADVRVCSVQEFPPNVFSDGSGWE